MTEENEIDILKRFKSEFENFPKGKIYKSEQPDFIVKSSKKKIGIEITEIFQDSYKGHSKYQQLSSDRHKFTNLLIKKLQSFVDFTFHISIDFNDFIHVNKSKQIEILKLTFESCINHLIQLKNKQQFLIEDFRILPEQINSIRIARFDGLDESSDERPEGGVVSDMTELHIGSILFIKENKLNNYEECDEQWLLIKEGNYYAGTFIDIKVKTPVKSSFDKVFLFRINKQEILILK